MNASVRTRPVVAHLQGPVSVGLGEAQVDEAGHGQSHVEPVTEAEVVDELEDVLHTQEDQTHQALQPHSGTRLTGSAPFHHSNVPAKRNEPPQTTASVAENQQAANMVAPLRAAGGAVQTSAGVSVCLPLPPRAADSQLTWWGWGWGVS